MFARYFEALDAEVTPEERTDNARASHHITLSVDCVAGLPTLSADIALWRPDGCGAVAQLPVSQNITLAQLEKAWQGLGVFADIPYEVLPASYRVVNNERDLRQVQEAPDKWVHVDLASSVSREGRALLRELFWLGSANADDEDAWHAEVRAQPLPLLYNEGQPAVRLRQHFIEPLAARILALSETPGMGFRLAREQIVAEYPAYRYLSTNRDSDDIAPTAMPYEFYLALHFKRAGGRLFHIRDALLERLDLSDIEVGLPLAVLHAPFPDCYLHLESPRRLDNFTADGTPGWLRGFYVSEKPATGDAPQARQLSLAPIVTAGLNLTTAYSEEIVLAIEPDDQRDLAGAFDELVEKAPSELPEDIRRAVFRQFALCAKILAYIGVREARLVERNERTEKLRSAASLSGKLRKRAIDKAARLHDYIEVGPEKSLANEAAETGHRPGRAFWRRGHFRMQPYGPSLSLRRMRWIQPALVNAAALEVEEEAKVPEYRVR